MFYGADLPLALFTVVAWSAATSSAGRIAYTATNERLRRGAATTLWLSALAVLGAAGFALVALGGLGWFVDPALVWVHLGLTAVPALVGVLALLPRLRALRPPREAEPAGRPDPTLLGRAAHPLVLLPPHAATAGAVTNLYFLLVAHAPLRAVDVAVPLAVLALWAGASAYRFARRRHTVRATSGSPPGGGRAAIARAATSTGMALVAVAAWALVSIPAGGPAGVRSGGAEGDAKATGAYPVTRARVPTEGDDLHVETRGSGDPLLMISGGGGDAGFYSSVADRLASEYRVITYDRRGNSRSTRNHPDRFDVSQQARDARAVLDAVGADSAHVFGNSGGAIIALELARSHPEAVRRVVAHEPPTIGVLPDSRRWFALYDSIHRTSRVLGAQAAHLQFSLSLKAVPVSAYSHVRGGLAERLAANNEYFVRQEMLPFVHYRPDIATIRENGVDIVIAAGELTLRKGAYYGRTAPIIARNLDTEMVAFPGHHLSYLDEPQRWSRTLKNSLRPDE